MHFIQDQIRQLFRRQRFGIPVFDSVASDRVPGRASAVVRVAVSGFGEGQKPARLGEQSPSKGPIVASDHETGQRSGPQGSIVVIEKIDRLFAGVRLHERARLRQVKKEDAPAGPAVEALCHAGRERSGRLGAAPQQQKGKRHEGGRKPPKDAKDGRGERGHRRPPYQPFRPPSNLRSPPGSVQRSQLRGERRALRSPRERVCGMACSAAGFDTFWLLSRTTTV